MNIPKATTKELQKKYKDSSIKTLLGSIKRVLKELYNIDTYKPELLFTYTKVIKWIEGIDNMASRKNILAAILAILRAEPDTPKGIIAKYEEYFNKLAKKVETDRKYAEPKQEELDNWISYNDVKKKFNEYEKIIKKINWKKENGDETSFISPHDKNLFLRYMILAFYTFLPPLRGEEYFNTAIISQCKEKSYDNMLKLLKKNLLDVSNGNLVSKYYKTANVYGTRIIPIPKNILTIVKQFRQINGYNPYLVPNLTAIRAEPMTQQAFTALMYRIFDPYKISTSMLRKIYISDALKEIKDPDERKKLAYIMGHSIDAQEFIYKRFK